MPGPPVISPDDPYVLARRTVHVWLVGIECGIRQESSDEIYGSVGLIVSSTRTSSVTHFPQGVDYLSMGDDGARIVSLQLQLYDGPPADLVLSSILVEHDSGDTSEYKRRIAEAIATAAQAGAASLGVPAEATAADQGWINDLSVGIADLLLGWVGADDDAYTPQATRISGRDILTAYGIVEGTLPNAVQPFAERVLTRDDTPDVRLAYNIGPVRVSGEDQGGDRGSYAFYYRIELFEEGTKIL
jgi:hypothetical protein